MLRSAIATPWRKFAFILMALLMALVTWASVPSIMSQAKAGSIVCGDAQWDVWSVGARFYVNSPCYGWILMVPGDFIAYDTPPGYASMRIDPRVQCQVKAYGSDGSVKTYYWYNQSYTYSIDKTIPYYDTRVQSCWNY